MPRASEKTRSYKFKRCLCRIDLPFRGKGIAAHARKFPEHKWQDSFRACLSDLETLPSNSTRDAIAAFHEKHEKCPTMKATSRKSREFFSSLKTSQYLTDRQQQREREVAALEADKSTEVACDEDEEEEEDEEDDIWSDDSDFETHQAVSNILEAVPPQSPPAAIPQVAPPQAAPPQEDAAPHQWAAWTQQMVGLFTPQIEPSNMDVRLDPSPPGSPSGLPPSPRPVIAAEQPAAATTATAAPAPAPPEVGPLIAGGEMVALSKQALKDRVASLRRSNEVLQAQQRNWEKRLHSMRRREEEMNEREAVLDSTQQVLATAQQRLELKEAALDDKAKALAEERAKLAAERAELIKKDAELQHVHAQLKTARARIEAAPEVELHLPLAGAAIVADPMTDACNVTTGDGCGHLRLKAGVGGKVTVVSYHNVAFTKRPATTNLHQPPATKPRTS